LSGGRQSGETDFMVFPGRFSQISERKPQQAPALFIAFPQRFELKKSCLLEKIQKKRKKREKALRKRVPRPSNSYKHVFRTDPQYS